MYDSYYSTDNAQETLESSLPAVLKCLNPLCTDYFSEYVVWRLEQKHCPGCQLQGCLMRCLRSKKVLSYKCGLCLRVMWLEEDRWPVGHYDWGIIQLSNKTKMKYICNDCQIKVTNTFKNLRAEVTQEILEETLPRIVQPSKLLLSTKDG